MQLFIALLVIIWAVVVALVAVADAFATSRSSGVAQAPLNWWLVGLFSGFLATILSLAITGFVALF